MFRNLNRRASRQYLGVASALWKNWSTSSHLFQAAAVITIHTVYVISLVSQTTSALVLTILAWIDRRSRWLVPLAVACALHAAAIYLMPLWRDTGRWVPLALSQANLVCMFYLIHLGLQSLVYPLKARSPRIHAVVLTLMVLVFVLARSRPIWCIRVAMFATACVVARTVGTLWPARTRGLRAPLRATAILLSVITLQLLVRLPMESLVPSPPLLLLLRKTTMLLVTFMAFSFLALYAAESRRRLHEESRLDVLTGLPNRRAMEEGAARHVQLATRHGRPCVLLMLDLDDFKKLNDTWGHDRGDAALRAAGDVLLRAAGEISNCAVARMGGEEFAMVLSDWSVAAAHMLAEQLRDEIAAVRLREGDRDVRFTASIGLSALQAGESTWTGMLRRADVALYRAKREGRNRVVLCAEALRAALGEVTALPAYDGNS